MEIIRPESREAWLQLRRVDITSTESAALFNCSPYLTQYELWHRMKHQEIVELIPNEQMEIGTFMEPAIAKFLAHKYNLCIRKMEEYIRDTMMHMGASYDYAITHRDNVPLDDEEGLEIKHVHDYSFKEGWIVSEDDVEAPPHIEIQVQHQMALIPARKVTHIGAMIGGRTHKMISRARDEKTIDAIRKKVAAFHRSIAEHKECPFQPDFSHSTTPKFISRLYSSVEAGKVLDAVENSEIFQLAEQYREMHKQETKFAAEKKILKAKLLMMINDAEKVIGNGFSISSGWIGEKMIEAYPRKGYRDFRVNWKKVKEGVE